MTATVGLSKFFMETSHDISGYEWRHNRALTLYLRGVQTRMVCGVPTSVGFPDGEMAPQGYRPGVVLLPIPLDVLTGLRSRVVEVDNNTQFVTLCKSRVEGEAPRMRSMALVDSLPLARFVTAVLYHKDVLAENSERSTDCEWELIALLCQMDSDEPMVIGTLLANHFGADGGTQTLMSSVRFESELRKSYNYWKTRSMGMTHDEWAKHTAVQNG